MFNKGILIYKRMTRMRHFHLTINSGDNESGYAIEKKICHWLGTFYYLSDFQMGQGWHEDPSGKDRQARPSPFST